MQQDSEALTYSDEEVNAALANNRSSLDHTNSKAKNSTPTNQLLLKPIWQICLLTYVPKYLLTYQEEAGVLLRTWKNSFDDVIKSVSQVHLPNVEVLVLLSCGTEVLYQFRHLQHR